MEYSKVESTKDRSYVKNRIELPIWYLNCYFSIRSVRFISTVFFYSAVILSKARLVSVKNDRDVFIFAKSRVDLCSTRDHKFAHTNCVRNVRTISKTRKLHSDST